MPASRPNRRLFSPVTWLLVTSIVAIACVQVTARRPVQDWVDDGFEVEEFATVSQPSAICVDGSNRVFVIEANSFVLQDLTGFEQQLAARTMTDSESLAAETPVTWRGADRVCVLTDKDGDGQSDEALTIAEGFPLQHGVASGLAVYGKTMWLGNSPNLWRFDDAEGNGRFSDQKVLHRGFGVRRVLREHGLHDIVLGPDGKLYFAMGDRGLHVKTRENEELFVSHSGCVLRCQPDGSELEVFATGLRNPYGLAFDQYGNLWTADNDSNWGDRSRWVYVVEGGDSGWQVGHQLLPEAGRFNSERIWDPNNDIPFRVPATGCVGHGPAGVAYYPGTGLPTKFDGRFFLCDYTGKVFSIAVEPKGAGYKLSTAEETLHVPAPTDIAFGPDGTLYIADWIALNATEAQGRILRFRHPITSKQPGVREVQKLLAEGMTQRSREVLASLLGHRDIRVRQEAQFELANRVESATFCQVIHESSSQLASIHAIWGLSQISRVDPLALAPIISALNDHDAEVRAQAARSLGDHPNATASDALRSKLKDPSARVQYFALLALGKLHDRESAAHIIDLARNSSGTDPFIRHAVVMALTGLGDIELLQQATNDRSREVRLTALLAMRRLKRPEIVDFLNDPDSLVVEEATRAIHDVPIPECYSELAKLLFAEERSESVMVRVTNTHFRLGTHESAAALAEFAQRQDVSTAARVNAIEALQSWSNTNLQDRVLGMRSLVAARSNSAAREALERHLSNLLSDPAEEVASATNSAAKFLDIAVSSASLRERLADAELAPHLRADALKLLVARDVTDKPVLIEFGFRCSEQAVQLQAICSLPAIEDLATVELLASVAAGQQSLPLRQAAVSALGSCTSADAESALSELIDHAIAGRFPATVAIELVEAAAAHGSEHLASQIESLNARSRDAMLGDNWVAVEGGDVRRGRDIFTRHAGVQCARCHSLDSHEAKAGPSLAFAGRQSRRHLLESILDPNKVIAAGYGQTILLLEDGTSASGIIESESDTSLRLRLLTGDHATYRIDQIEHRSLLRSGMPTELASKLSKRELRDLIAFLASLGDVTIQGLSNVEL